MTRRTKWLALFAAALALLVGSRMVLRYLDNQASEASRVPALATYPDDGIDPAMPASKVGEARLQALATGACRCTRERGDASEEACWQDYKTAIEPFTINSVATACAPISTELDCIATDAGEKCIVTSYGNGICTAEEADAADRAYTQALNAEGEFSTLGEAAAARANERAGAAFRDVVERIRRGERLAASRSSGGCT